MVQVQRNDQWLDEETCTTKVTQLKPSHFWIDTHLFRLTRKKTRHIKEQERPRERNCKLLTSNQGQVFTGSDLWGFEEILFLHQTPKQRDCSGVSSPKVSDELPHSDTLSKAELLNNQFHLVYTKEKLSDMPSKGDSPHPTFMSNIFASELATILTKQFQLSNFHLIRYWKSTRRLKGSIHCPHI